MPDSTCLMYRERHIVLCFQDIQAGNTTFDLEGAMAFRCGGGDENRTDLCRYALVGSAAYESTDYSRGYLRPNVHAYCVGDGPHRNADSLRLPDGAAGTARQPYIDIWCRR